MCENCKLCQCDKTQPCEHSEEKRKEDACQAYKTKTYHINKKNLQLSEEAFFDVKEDLT
jgi:hypothetical protein